MSYSPSGGSANTAVRHGRCRSPTIPTLYCLLILIPSNIFFEIQRPARHGRLMSYGINLGEPLTHLWAFLKLKRRSFERLFSLSRHRNFDRARRDIHLAMCFLYGSPEISGHECVFHLRPRFGSRRRYGAGEAGAQATAQSERIRPWLVANRFQAISQASMMSARLGNTELASQWLRR